MTITAALVALVYAVVEAPEAGWAGGQTLGLLALAAALIAAFVAIESRSAAPLAPLSVFRSRSLVGGNLVLFALGTTGFAVPFVLTQYAQEVLGWSPTQFGLASLVMPVTAVIGTASAQAIATRGGVRRVAVVAMALAGLGSLLLTQVSVGGSYLSDLLPGLLLLGPGIGAAYVAGSIASLTGVAEIRGRARLRPQQRLVPDRRRGRRGDPVQRRRLRRARRVRWPRSPTATGPPSPRRSPSPRWGSSPRACCSARAASAAPPSRPSRPPPDP